MHTKFAGDKDKPHSLDEHFTELAKRDNNATYTSCRLACTPEAKRVLIPQSTLGHAQNGHKEFWGRKYPDATLEAVFSAIEFDVDQAKGIRQKYIDDVFKWVDLAVQGKVNKLELNKNPLMGLTFLSQTEVDPEFVLKGMILGGLMDSYDWRMKTLEESDHKNIFGKPLTIGGGESYLVNPDNLIEWDMYGLEKLATEEFNQEQITHLKNIGVITNQKDPRRKVAYIRRKKGLGTSDDTAFIMMGEMYKNLGEKKALSAMLGGFIADAIDTYDKFVSRPFEGGYDEKLGNDLRDAMPDLVSDKEITNVIYYAAKDNGQKVVSSSHKRLIQVIEIADPKQSTFQHHMKYHKTGRYAPFKIGFDRISSGAFYAAVKERVHHYHEHK